MLITCNIRHSCKLLLLFWTFFYGFDRSNLILLKGASMPFSYIYTYNIAWSLKISIQQQKLSDSSFLILFSFHKHNNWKQNGPKIWQQQCFYKPLSMFHSKQANVWKKEQSWILLLPRSFCFQHSVQSLCVCVCVCVCVCLCTLMCVMLSCLADCSQRSGTLQAP